MKTGITDCDFDEIMEVLRQSCFHMSDTEAEVEVDKVIKNFPEILEYELEGVKITKEWLIKNS